MLKTALRFMFYDKPKTFGALFGVIIANFLIGQQLGIFIFLTNAMAVLSNNIQTDLWVVDKTTSNVNSLGLVDIRYGKQIESIKGVEKVSSFLMSGATVRFSDGKTTPVVVLGSEFPRFVGGAWNIQNGKLTDLLKDGAVMIDYFDKASFGKKNIEESMAGEYFEVGGKKAFCVAETKGVRGFGGIYMFSEINQAQLFCGVSKYKTSAFLVKLDANTNRELVKQTINSQITGMKAWTPEEFSAETIREILATSGIAASTGTLIVFAILSGMIIIGLTLYSAAVERLKDYATLKAIGASNGFVSLLIFSQAGLIALVGFGIGVGLIEGFRMGIAQGGVIFNITLPLYAALFAVTLLISLGGAYFAVRRVTQVEPATVFRA